MMILLKKNKILCDLRKGLLKMRNISKEYLLLFNTLTDAENALAQLYTALVSAQRQAEDLYLSEPDDENRRAG
jgi:hypothetical protein